MPEKEKIEGSHKDHRKRLRQRFEKSGFKGFHDYEVLELLLTYSVPRIDTKGQAKALIKKFKSLPGVLAADENQLVEIDGIGPFSARFLKVIDATLSFYFEQQAKNDGIQFTNLADLEKYFRALIGNKTNEVTQALYLDTQNKYLYMEDLGEGTVTEAVAFPRKIVESALKYKATAVIIAHNHPGGIPEPSENDDTMTHKIDDALKTVSINLQEHIIIAPEGYYSYRQNGLLI